MKEHVDNLLQDDQLIYISCESTERIYEMNKQERDLCLVVTSLQEEPNSEIILHAAVAAEDVAQQIAVDNTDTDVLVFTSASLINYQC